MKVCPEDYRYKVCTYCRSKKIELISCHIANPDFVIGSPNTLDANRYHCDNCRRIFLIYEAINMTDKAEMKRDIDRLLAFLNGGSEAGDADKN